MFGRLPWLAFERRMRALRFLVFFDIGVKAIGQMPQRHKPLNQQMGGQLSLTPASTAIGIGNA
jgi:hypothetical protein